MTNARTLRPSCLRIRSNSGDYEEDRGSSQELEKFAKLGRVTSAQTPQMTAYTDGACSGNPGPAGLGVVLTVGGETHELSEFLGVATNNIAELTAIRRALEYGRQHGAHLEIFTDSRYAIGVLTAGWKAKANRSLIADIKADLATFGAVRFHHVRGHVGIPANERADELARAAIARSDTAPWSSS